MGVEGVVRVNFHNCTSLFFSTNSTHFLISTTTQRPCYCDESLQVLSPPVYLHDEILLVARANLERALRVEVGHEMKHVGHLLEHAPVPGARAALAVEVVHVLPNVIFYSGGLRYSTEK